MDSKSGPPPSSYEDDGPAPPSYTESLSSPYGASSSTSKYYSSQIASQLTQLTQTITSLQTQKSLLSDAQDEKILSLLTHHIQIYLADFAKSGLQRGTLILVPRRGLSNDNSTPCEYDIRNPEEYDRVVKVGEKDGEAYLQRERDEYGSFADRDDEDHHEMWFWKDEEMALRLAGYLRPQPDPRTMELPPRKEEVKAAEPEASSGRSFWGRKKSIPKVVETRPPLVEQRTDSKMDTRASAVNEDKILMDVKAEEVVFRYENAFGIYETERGYCVVLNLRVILGRR